MNESDLVSLSQAVPKEDRKCLIMRLPEKDLHLYLKELFKKLEPDYVVEITHGADELGKDLVIVKEDRFGVEVIGVVVKVGDIRATTLGDVDDLKFRTEKIIGAKGKDSIRLKEIESQIAQAANNPGKLKTIFSEIKVNRVYVVLAGYISAQARQRLQAELASKVEVFDLNWLIDNFTNHYPQIFFDGIAIDFLYEIIAALEKRHMLSKKGKNLSDYFVEPMVTETELPLELDEKSLSIILKKKKFPFLHLKSILPQKRRLLIVGEPGCGKSAALAKLAIDEYKAVLGALSKKDNKKKIDIPLLINAKDLVGIDNLDSFITRFLPKEECRDRFNICALLVDALDEAPPADRSSILEFVTKIGQALDCSVLVTSRKIDAIDTSVSGFIRYELMPFEFGQAIKLIQKMLSNKSLLNSIREGLEKIRHEIPLFPLSLVLIIDLAEESKEIPASVTEIYDRFFDISLGRWDKDKGIRVLFEYLIKKNFLGALAFHEFFLKNRIEIPISEFESFLADYAALYGWSKEIVRGFINEIERAGIISIRKAVIFRHRSFLDYFVAFHIYDKREDIPNLKKMLVDTYFDESWSEAVFFYIGLKRESSEELLESILSSERDDSLTSFAFKYTIGRLLQAGWNTPTLIKRSTISKGIEFSVPIKNKLLGIIEKDRKIPRILADIMLVGLGDLAYSSGFIANENKEILDRLVAGNNPESITSIIPLFSATSRFLAEDEIDERAEKIMALSKRLNPAEEASALVFLLMIKSKDKELGKTIKRRLNFLSTRHRKTMSRLLPMRKKGFR